MSSLAWIAAGLVAASSLDYEVVRLEGLAPGEFSARAINGSGEVAGLIFGTESRAARAFVWSEGGLVTLELQGLDDVLALNDDGVVIGVSSSPAACSVFAWFSRKGEVRIVPTPVGAFPADVNRDLLVVGGDCGGLEGFALDVEQRSYRTIAFGPLPPQGVGTPGALGINENGVVVGSEVIFDSSLGYWIETPYRWTEAGGIGGLETLSSGFGGRGIDVNRWGDAAGYVIDDVSGKQTALWKRGGELRNLGSPFNFFVSEATAINARKQITVVAPNDLFGFTRAFLWDRGSFLDLSAFTIPAVGLFALRPLDINDGGEILVQLGDAQGLRILDVVILRPVRHGPRWSGGVSGPKPVSWTR